MDTFTRWFLYLYSCSAFLILTLSSAEWILRNEGWEWLFLPFQSGLALMMAVCTYFFIVSGPGSLPLVDQYGLVRLWDRPFSNKPISKGAPEQVQAPVAVISAQPPSELRSPKPVQLTFSLPEGPPKGKDPHSPLEEKNWEREIARKLWGIVCPKCGSKDLGVMVWGQTPLTARYAHLSKMKLLRSGGCFGGESDVACNGCGEEFESGKELSESGRGGIKITPAVEPPANRPKGPMKYWEVPFRPEETGRIEEFFLTRLYWTWANQEKIEPLRGTDPRWEFKYRIRTHEASALLGFLGEFYSFLDGEGLVHVEKFERILNSMRVRQDSAARDYAALPVKFPAILEYAGFTTACSNLRKGFESILEDGPRTGKEHWAFPLRGTPSGRIFRHRIVERVLEELRADKGSKDPDPPFNASRTVIAALLKGDRT